MRSDVRNAHWFLLHEHQFHGPYDVDQLNGAVESGALPVKSRVWREGMDQWSEIETLPAFSQAVLKAPVGRGLAAPTDLSFLKEIDRFPEFSNLDFLTDQDDGIDGRAIPPPPALGAVGAFEFRETAAGPAPQALEPVPRPVNRIPRPIVALVAALTLSASAGMFYYLWNTGFPKRSELKILSAADYLELKRAALSDVELSNTRIAATVC